MTPDASFGPVFVHAASFCYELVVVEVMAMVMVVVVVVVVVVAIFVVEKMSLPISVPFWTCCLHL